MVMTSRERVEAALRHREPDRTPIFEYVLLSPVADQLLGRLYGGDPAHWPSLLAELGWEGAVRRAATDRLDLAALLGHDMLYVYSTGSRHPVPPAPMEAPLPDDPVERVARRNELAEASAAKPDDDSLYIYACIKEEMARRGMDLPILAPAYAHGGADYGLSIRHITEEQWAARWAEQGLLLDAQIISLDAAHQILERSLAVNAEWLPNFHR
ncbi:MAG: hypothetical protein ACUVWR_18960 [Anaerolineae bacterium]